MGPASGGPPLQPVGAQAGVRLVRLTPGLLALVLTFLGLLLLGKAAGIFFLFFVAILIAVYLATFTDAIEAKTKWKRGLAFTAALVATGLALWGIEALLVPPVVEQTRQLIDNLPRYATAWQEWLGRMVIQFPALEPFVGGERKQDVINAIIGQAEGFVAGAFPKVFELLNGLIHLVSVLVMAIYFARQPELYTDLAVSLTPPKHRPAAREVLRALGETLRNWVFAQLFNMCMMGLLTAIGLWALGVPYWLAFGIFTGLVAIVPFFGTLVSTILPALFVLDQGITKVVLVLVLGIVVHVIEGNVVAPMIFHKGVKLPPVLTILSVLIVGTLAGPVGLLVAVPLLAVLMVLLRSILLERVYGDPPPVPEGPPVGVAPSPTAAAPQ
jgi:predicted PurR-regulated permease PerM